jgi:hypothetical protein
MARLIGLLAAAMITVLPLTALPDWRVGAASGAAALCCAAGVLLPSLGFACAGAIMSLLIFAAASMTVPAGTLIPEAIALGAALLSILDCAHFQRCFQGSSVDRGVDQAHLTGLAGSVAMAVAAGLPLIWIATAFSMEATAMLRPVLAAAGGLLVFVSVVQVFARASMPALRTRAAASARK